MRSEHQICGLWEMLEIKGKPILSAHYLITQLMLAMHDQHVKRFAPDTVGHIEHQLDELRTELVSLDFKIALISLSRAKAQIADPAITPQGFGHIMRELHGRIMDEIESSYLLTLSQAEVALFEPKSPLWGDKVAQGFPSIQDDITEAGKCLGLGRYTASAFHSLRCLEAGILALSRCLCLPDPTKGAERSWSKILGSIDAERKKRWLAKDLLAGDGREFDELYGALAGMQNPWRNATMHLDQFYTEEQASNVFNVVKSFMRRLAERMDEDGKPEA
ncbi:hypothetical protein [Blastomonas sp.]|uniref:hypothetical protein n=1 Tax=Blastomonas sp. TaxID=1909299 RepID=UPI00391D405E